jgi:hypothetical protein
VTAGTGLIRLVELSPSIPPGGSLTAPPLEHGRFKGMGLAQLLNGLGVVAGRDVLAQTLLLVEGPHAEFTLSA